MHRLAVPVRVAAVVLVSLACAVACSGTTTGTGTSSSSSSSSSSSGTSSGGSGPPSDCVDQCTQQANGCNQDSRQCASLCAKVNGSQFACIQAAGCNTSAAANCLKAGSSSGTSGTSGTSGMIGTSGGSCVRLGQTGCNTFNNPSNCCTDTAHPSVKCNGNNDGQGHAQCCVNPGDACTASSDCCGNASNPTINKCCPSGKCGSGC